MNVIYFQTTPIPDDLRPPMDACEFGGKNDPLSEFLNIEKSAFDTWTDHLPLNYFDIVTGYPTRFAVFVSKLPNEDDCPLMDKVKVLLDDINTGAVLGDVGTIIDGVSMSSRARWTVTEHELNKKKPGLLGPDRAYRRLRLLLFLFCLSLSTLLFFIFTG